MTLQTAQALSRQNVIAMILVGASMVLGGGGSPAPLPELALQLLALVFFVLWAALTPGVLVRVPRQTWIIVAGLLILPCIQLVPMPSALWHMLPGRATERAALALVGAENSWQPWSISPPRTLAALLAMLVPAIVVLMTANLEQSGRAMVVGAIFGIALLALIVGVGQISAGESNAFRFYVPDVGYLNGFQANHNSAADVLLIGMVAGVATLREASERRLRGAKPTFLLAAAAGLTFVFSLGVFLTASRAGAMLLPVAWLGILALVWPWLRFNRRQIIMASMLVVVGMFAASLLFSSSGMIARVVGRYTFEGEFRPELWKDAIFAMQQYFPFGSGMGTIVPVLIGAERLEVVDVTLPNRVHNDFLELAVETGVFGTVILAVIASILSKRLLAAMRGQGSLPVTNAIFAGTTFAVVALHSMVDYPLRSISLASIAAVAAGLLMPLPGLARTKLPIA